MKKIIIKTDKPNISEERILAKKPAFEKVLQNYHAVARPFYKSSWFSGGVASVIIATVVLVGYHFISVSGNHSTANSDSLRSKPFINKPFKDKDIPYETISVSSNCSHQLVTKSGTVLRIPENAFVDSLSKPVSFPIELKYREFRNPVDFFEAGIPMNYDSAGVGYTFESAGMFELLASKDGQDLSLAKGKAIGVDMKSPSDESDFNIYYLDTAKRKWVYVGKDVIADLAKDKNAAIPTGKIIREEASELNSSVVPVKADKSKYVFKLAVDLQDFPELNVYKNVLYQVDESTKKFDPKLYSVKWKSAKLLDGETKGDYLLMLSKNDTSVTIPVIPVFDEKNYANAISVYDQNIKEQKKEKLDRDKLIDQNRQTMLSSKNSLLQTTDIVTNVLSTEMKSLRSFDITSFGTWNCDRPIPPINRDFTITPKFINSSTGEALAYENAYIVDLNKNALFSYAQSKTILCNKRSDNVMWILTPDNKIGIVNPQVFSDAVKESTSPQFSLNLLSSSEGINVLKSLTGGKNKAQTDSISAIATKDQDTKLEAIAYPNPTRDFVNIKLTKAAEVTYSVFDINGKLVLTGHFSEAEYKINLSNQKSGIYNICLITTDTKKSKTLKVIKE